MRCSELVAGTTSVGRSSKNDFPINHPTISRKHAELIFSDDRLLVRDLGSYNGTFIDHIKITTCFARPDQTIQFGSVEYLISDRLIELDESSKQDTMSRKLAVNSLNPSLIPKDISPSEMEVLNSLIEGLGERQIASRLVLSRHTIHNHIRSIYRKFRVHSRAELMASLLHQTAEH
ncbi:MAG: FHA domain-containing protein [Pirellulaceae bacterium]